MVASAPDAVDYDPVNHSTVALAMETMYGYTAYFADDDPRLMIYSLASIQLDVVRVI